MQKAKGSLAMGGQFIDATRMAASAEGPLKSEVKPSPLLTPLFVAKN